MINLDTVLSEFDDRGTLLKYLNKVGVALNNASLKTVEVNQVSTTQVKLKFIFADDSYVESPVLTMPQGEQGLQGPQGETGPQGERGLQGPTGQTGPRGETGPAGKDGNSFNIIGNVTSVSQLPQTAPAGTAYFVGASAPRDIYVFDTGTNAWVNQGKLQGPRGETGPQGPQGPTGPAGTNATVDANKLHELIVGSQHIVADLNSGGDKIEIRLDNAILESITNAISDISKLKTGKQDNLVSGTNIKSINSTSLLGSGDIKIESGGGASGVQLSSPSTATNGTITQGQLTTLQESDLNYIIFNNEIYSLNDKTHTADTLTYSHVGFENGKHLLKTISITVSTRAWVLNTTSVVDSYEYRMFKINNSSDNISTSIKEIYVYTNKFDTASRFQDFLQNAYDRDMIFSFSCVAITPTDTIINAQFFYDLNIDPSSYFVIFNDKSEYVEHQNLVVVESD